MQEAWLASVGVSCIVNCFASTFDLHQLCRMTYQADVVTFIR